MVGRLAYLITYLSKTIHAWKEFQEHDIYYFVSDVHADDESPSPSQADYLGKIEQTFTRLGGYLDRLKSLKDGMIESDRHTVS